MNHETLYQIAKHHTNRETLARLIRRDVLTDSDGWRDAGLKFLRFLDDGNPRFSVWVEGNRKLPFLAFSTLPVVTCPGAGDCVNWCYSLKSWRYPSAFFLQLQNAVLMVDEIGRHNIRIALFALLSRKKYRERSRVDVRVNVDGDMRGPEDFAFWDTLANTLPRTRFYCYTKSYDGLAAWAETRELEREEGKPGLLVNLSNGSRHDEDKELKDSLKNLTNVRGVFEAVALDRHYRPFEMKGAEYKDAVKRAAGNKKVFVCPGKCGDCTTRGHACGSGRFNGVPIVIGIH